MGRNREKGRMRDMRKRERENDTLAPATLQLYAIFHSCLKRRIYGQPVDPHRVHNSSHVYRVVVRRALLYAPKGTHINASCQNAVEKMSKCPCTLKTCVFWRKIPDRAGAFACRPVLDDAKLLSRINYCARRALVAIVWPE